MKTTRRILYSIELAALVLVLLLFACWYNIRKAEQREEWVEYTNEVLRRANLVLSRSAESELQARNYMLTGSLAAKELSPVAAAAAKRELAKLRKLTLDHLSYASLLDSAAYYLDKKTSFFNRLIELRQTRGLPAALAFVQTAEGWAYSDHAKLIINQIERDELALLNTRQTQSDRASQAMNTSLIVTMAFIGAVLFLVLKRFRDEVRARRDLLEQLLASSKWMAAAERLAAFGSYSIDPGRWTINGSQEMYRILDGEAGADIPLRDMLKLVHPDDLEFMKAKVAALPGAEGTDQYGFRTLNAAGQVKYLQNGVSISRDEAGKLTGITGYIQDVTDWKIAEQKLGEAYRERESILHDLVARNRSLEEFTHMVSHNLRLPVANILGLGELLDLLVNDPKERDEAVKDMVLSARQLDGIVKQLNETLHLSEKPGNDQWLLVKDKRRVKTEQPH